MASFLGDLTITQLSGGDPPPRPNRRQRVIAYVVTAPAVAGVLWATGAQSWLGWLSTVLIVLALAHYCLAERKPTTWRLFRLERDLRYDLGGGVVVCVPAGFVTDGPSIPQFLWAILPVWGIWGRAGVVHDFLCCLIAMRRPHEGAPTRAAADRIFARAMWDLNVDWVQFSILYCGVWIGRKFRVRTTMVDFNVKLAAVLDLHEHPHTRAALGNGTDCPTTAVLAGLPDGAAVAAGNAAANAAVEVAKQQVRSAA